MRRRELLRTLLASPLGVWIRPWIGSPADVASLANPNAATLYRQAFQSVKSSTSIDRRWLFDCATTPLDAEWIGPLLREAGPALDAIRRGSAIAECDWGPGPVSLDDLHKDHLDVNGVSAVRLACLAARLRAAEGRTRDALDDLFSALTLARRIGHEGVFFARVLEAGAIVSTFNTIGRMLPDLDRASLDDLSRRLDAFPPPAAASTAIGPESRFILGTIRTKVETMGPVLREEDWDDLDLDDAETESLKVQIGGDRAALLAHLDAHGPAFADLARRIDLPWPEWRAALDGFAETNRSSWPIAASAAEAADGLRHTIDRQHALHAMARAGLALVRDGEPAFARAQDPFAGGRPFGLERRGKGFVLRSALSEPEKPEISLNIGDIG